MVIRLTMILSSMSFSLSVATDRRIKSDRSYVGIISTPGGSAGRISCILALTRSMTSRVLSPKRTTTMPPTTSPFPFSSASPRRRSGPNSIRAMSLSKMGVPLASVPTAICSKSCTDSTYPRPQTIYSRPVNSTTRPPTSLLLIRMAWIIVSKERL